MAIYIVGGTAGCATIPDALTTIGAVQASLVVPSGTHALTDIKTTIESNINLKVLKGANISLDIFAGTGTVSTNATAGANTISSSGTIVTLDAGVWPAGVTYGCYITATAQRKKVIRMLTTTTVEVESAFSVPLVNEAYTYSTKVITGVDTLFTTEVIENYSHVVLGGKRYVVETVDGATQLTLARHPEDALSGAVYSVACKLWLNQTIDAGNYPIFSGDGTVNFAPSQQVNVVWFTSSGNGLDTSMYTGIDGMGGIGEAINRVRYARVFYCPSGKYTITAEIPIRQDGTVIKGLVENRHNEYEARVMLEINATAAINLFNLDRETNAVLYNTGLLNLYMTSNSNFDHTFIRANAVSHPLIDNIYVYQPTGSYGNCTGIQTYGHDLLKASRLHLQCSYPIKIGKNRIYGTSTYDADAWIFRDLTMVGKSTADAIANSLIALEDNVWFTHLIFEGYQSWQGGKFGFYWDDTNGAVAATGLTFRNIKSEQADPTTGTLFYISPHTGLNALLLEHCSESVRTGSFLTINKVNQSVLNQCLYAAGSGYAITGAGNYLVDVNGFNTARAIDLADMSLLFSVLGTSSNQEKLSKLIYTHESAINSALIQLWGQNHYSYNGSMADDGQVTIAINPTSVAHIWASTSDGATTEAGYWVYTPTHADGTATLVQGTVNCAAADTDEKLCVFKIGGVNQCRVKNRLGGTKTVNVVVMWK